MLNYKSYGSGEPVIILHGLFGMLDNWVTPVNKMIDLNAGQSSGFRYFVVDQRNHGRSFHSDLHNYDLMVEDLHEFISEVVKSDHVVLLGHSMGGKTAMKFTQEFPELVSKLVVVDIGPGSYEVRHNHIIRGLKSVPLKDLKKRGDAVDYLSDSMIEPITSQFLLKSLFRTKEGSFRWRFNLNAIASNIKEMGNEVKSGIYEGPVLFIKGEYSDYLISTDPDLKWLFPNSEVKEISKSGHWVHAENPNDFAETVYRFLNGA